MFKISGVFFQQLHGIIQQYKVYSLSLSLFSLSFDKCINQENEKHPNLQEAGKEIQKKGYINLDALTENTLEGENPLQIIPKGGLHHWKDDS